MSSFEPPSAHSDPAPGPVDPTSPDPPGPDVVGREVRARAALAALRDAVERPATWSDHIRTALDGRAPAVATWWWAAAAVALAGAVVVGVLVWSGRASVGSGRGPGVSLALPSATATSESGVAGEPGLGSAGPSSTGSLVVEVAGAVVHPGVYHLAAGSRVGDLIARAGGLAADADGDRVNQAAALADGTLLYVPHIGQTDVPDPVDGSSAAGASGATDGAGGSDVSKGGFTGPPVDLNTANATELDALPGVGPATAAAIIAYRRQHGPFQRVDDLADVAGIGPAKLAQIRPHVRV